jgi:hypothetical protein
MRLATALRSVLILLVGAFIGVTVALVSDMSLPISAMHGRWQIEDWVDHPQATEETRREYTAARRQYPRTIEVRSFWRASVGARTDCSWSQHVRAWLTRDDSTDIWETTISCHGVDPIKLWLIPSNVNNQARNLAGLREHFTDMNNRTIGVTFDVGGEVRDIFYVPASWPKPVDATSGGTAK